MGVGVLLFGGLAYEGQQPHLLQFSLSRSRIRGGEVGVQAHKARKTLAGQLDQPSMHCRRPCYLALTDGPHFITASPDAGRVDAPENIQPGRTVAAGATSDQHKECPARMPSPESDNILSASLPLLRRTQPLKLIS